MTENNSNLPLLADDSLDLESQSDSQQKTCRICFENDDEEEVFKPCRCSGSSEWVHRTCLNEWRATSENPDAFYKCFSCNYQYRLQEKHIQKTYFKKLNIFLANHPFLFYILNMITIFSISLLIKTLDHDHKLLKLFRPQLNQNLLLSDFFGLNYSYFDDYFTMATVLFCIIFITIFVFNFLCCIKNKYIYLNTCCRSQAVSYLIFIAVIIVTYFFSFLIGTFLLTLLMQTIIKHHYTIIEKLNRAQEKEVLEFIE